jgi:hypothetical protein
MTNETLEELGRFAERKYLERLNNYKNRDFSDGVIEGAKWQQERMYSEEDLKEAFRSNYTPFSATNTGDFDEDFDRWFKQFKKK